jgi:hypothetical protein
VKDLLARQPLPAGPLARLYAATNDRERALAMLERVLASRPLGLQPLKGDPLFDGLRGDPRFRELLRRANLPEPSGRPAAG